MLFRLQHEDFMDISRKDFTNSDEYYTALMNVYGVKMPYVGIRDDIIQLDYICGLLARQKTTFVQQVSDKPKQSRL